jgi:hypothetical protein
MRIGLSPAALALGERVSASLFVENVSGLADHLLHGAHTRGWGEPTIPDPVLLTITGFDPATRQWRYATNGGFASALPTARANMPVRITAEIDVDIGTPLPEQLLKRSLDAGRRGHSGSRMTADELALRYERTVPNVFATLAELSDSLLLSPSQLRGLQEADDAYRAAVRPEWRALGIYLAALDDSYSTNDALRQITATTTRVWAIAQRDAQRLREIVTPIQLRLAPPTLATVLNASGPLTFRFTPAP